jgi:hypothetical protein
MSPGGKGGRCVGLKTLPPSCADCHEIWEPQPSAPIFWLSLLVLHVFLHSRPGSPGSLDLICQDTNSVFSFNFFIFHTSMGIFWFFNHCSRSDREITLISHSVEHLHEHKKDIFYFTDRYVCKSSTHSTCESDFIFFAFLRKTNVFYLSPQTQLKMKITASNNRIWKDFIYCTDDSCFKTDLYKIWWPQRRLTLQQS